MPVGKKKIKEIKVSNLLINQSFNNCLISELSVIEQCVVYT